jgi:hypothetical protein
MSDFVMKEVTAKASKELAAAIMREQLLPIHNTFVLRREQVNINFLNSFLLRLYGNYLLKVQWDISRKPG